MLMFDWAFRRFVNAMGEDSASLAIRLETALMAGLRHSPTHLFVLPLELNTKTRLPTRWQVRSACDLSSLPCLRSGIG